MLLVETSFLAQYGVKAESELKDFKLNRRENVQWLRDSILHYLDLSIAELYPNRNMYQLKDVDINKKIPITTIKELLYTDGLGPIIDRQRNEKLNKWKTEHTKTFKETDLLDKKITDKHMVPMVNYNPIKFNHKYTSTRFQNIDENYNYMKTYAEIMIKHVKGLPGKKHVVTLNIPNIIPGFKAINNILGFDKAKQALVINDRNTFWFLEWYKWMGTSTRKNSVFKDITDEDSKHIIMEFTSKGYSTFVPLHILRSLAIDSNLHSMTNLEETKHRKFFIKYVLMIQEKIFALNTVREKILDADTDDVVVLDKEESSNSLDNESIKANNDGVLPDSDIDIDKTIHEDKTEGFIDTFNIRGNDSRAVDKAMDAAYISGLSDNSLFEDLDDIDNLSMDVFNVDFKDAPKIARVAKDIKARKFDEVSENTSKEGIIEEVVIDEPMDEEPLSSESIKELLDARTPEETLERFIQQGSRTGVLTSSEIRALKRNNEKRRRLKSVYNDKQTVDEVMKLPTDLKELGTEIGKSPIKTKYIPENLKTKKIKAFDKHYREKMLKKDIIDSIYGIEMGEVMILDHSMKTVKSVADNYEEHRVTVKPLDGDQSTLVIRLPCLDNQDSMMVNGVKYRMRKTRQDLPIRKISPTKVSLQSNYGKLFTNKTPRMAYNREAYIDKAIRKSYLEGNGAITQIVPGGRRLNKTKGLPNDYFAVASKFDAIATPTYRFMFSKNEVNASLTPEMEAKLKKNTSVVFVGANIKDGTALVMDRENKVYTFPSMELQGNFTDLLGIERNKIPRSFVGVNVIGKEIPMVIALSYYMGFSNLIKLMNVKYRIIERRARVTLNTEYEQEFKFGDYKLVLDLDTEEKRLIFQGLNYFAKVIAEYNISEFDQKAVYLNLVESRGMGMFHLRELDNLDKLFLDPITKDVLREINEPTEFRRLLLRAVELLSTGEHPDINDPLYSRIRGNDRIPGLMYRVLASSIREYKLKGGKAKKVTLDPYKVWNTIIQDNSVKTREFLNPMLGMKEDSVVVLTGVDGLSAGAVPVELRSYHENDVGLISEGTVDSGNVALVTYASPYINVKNSRGIVKHTKEEFEENPAKIFSSSVMLAPLSQFDDQNGSPLSVMVMWYLP